jgi:hypothetical protein
MRGLVLPKVLASVEQEEAAEAVCVKKSIGEAQPLEPS